MMMMMMMIIIIIIISTLSVKWWTTTYMHARWSLKHFCVFIWISPAVIKHGRNKPETSAAFFKGKPYKLFFRCEVLLCLQNEYGTHSTALKYKKIQTRHSAKIFSCIWLARSSRAPSSHLDFRCTPRWFVLVKRSTNKFPSNKYTEEQRMPSFTSVFSPPSKHADSTSFYFTIMTDMYNKFT